MFPTVRGDPRFVILDPTRDPNQRRVTREFHWVTAAGEVSPSGFLGDEVFLTSLAFVFEPSTETVPSIHPIGLLLLGVPMGLATLHRLRR